MSVQKYLTSSLCPVNEKLLSDFEGNVTELVKRVTVLQGALVNNAVHGSVKSSSPFKEKDTKAKRGQATPQ